MIVPKELERFVKKGVEILEDPGIYIETAKEKVHAKCKYIGMLGNRPLVCIDETAPHAIEPAKKLLISYARIAGARYAALIVGEELLIYDVLSGKNVRLEDVDVNDTPVSPDERDYRVVAAFYPLIHCSCGVRKCEL